MNMHTKNIYISILLLTKKPLTLLFLSLLNCSRDSWLLYPNPFLSSHIMQALSQACVCVQIQCLHFCILFLISVSCSCSKYGTLHFLFDYPIMLEICSLFKAAVSIFKAQSYPLTTLSANRPPTTCLK